VYKPRIRKATMTTCDHDLVEAAAVELEDLRRGINTPLSQSSSSSSPPPPASALQASASTGVPPASASFDSAGTADTAASTSASASASASSRGSPADGASGPGRSGGGCCGDGDGPNLNPAPGGYRRANTFSISVPDPATAAAGSCPGRRFPASCLRLVRSLPGNSRCVDCEEMNPEWASVSYGVLLCLRCSGRHRGLGVNVRFTCRLVATSR